MLFNIRAVVILGICFGFVSCQPVEFGSNIDNDYGYGSYGGKYSPLGDSGLEPVITGPVIAGAETTGQCQGTGLYADVPGIAEWCNVNCKQGYCPQTHCSC